METKRNRNMRIKTLCLVGLLAGTSLVTGCASTTIKTELKCKKVNGETTCEGSIGTSTVISKLMKGLRPVTDMLAQTGVFDYQEFLDFEPSDYAFEYEGGSISDGIVTVTVYSYDSIVGTQNFGVTNTNGVYKFASPQSVKSYAQGFIDIATDVKVSAKTSQSSDTMVVKMLDSNDTVALTTFRRYQPPSDPTHVQ